MIQKTLQDMMRDSQKCRPCLVLPAIVRGIWCCLCVRALAVARQVFAHRKLRRCLALGALGALLHCCPQALAREAVEDRPSNQAAADILFTNGLVHILKISVPPEGLRSLRREPRTYVKATL